MQERKKKLNLKTLYRYRNIFRTNKSILNPTLYLLKITVYFNIAIKITQNNVFCTLINKETLKTVYLTSSGKEKIHTSRKTLRFSSRNIIVSFFRKIKGIIKNNTIFININAPLRSKILIIKLLNRYIKKRFIILYVQAKKCFNGCKPPKKKRKKQRGLRVFK